MERCSDCSNKSSFVCICGLAKCSQCRDTNPFCPKCGVRVAALQEVPRGGQPTRYPRFIVTASGKKLKRSRYRAAPASHDAFPDLTEVRVRQPKLVFIGGLPLHLCNESILSSRNWFGKFGKITKLSVNPKVHSNRDYVHQAFVQYSTVKEARKAIVKMHRHNVGDGRMIRCCNGSTKYCSYFVANLPCPGSNCTFLHDWCQEDRDLVTKDELYDHEGRLDETPNPISSVPSRRNNTRVFLPTVGKNAQIRNPWETSSSSKRHQEERRSKREPRHHAVTQDEEERRTTSPSASQDEEDSVTESSESSVSQISEPSKRLEVNDVPKRKDLASWRQPSPHARLPVMVDASQTPPGLSSRPLMPSKSADDAVPSMSHINKKPNRRRGFSTQPCESDESSVVPSPSLSGSRGHPSPPLGSFSSVSFESSSKSLSSQNHALLSSTRPFVESTGAQRTPVKQFGYEMMRQHNRRQCGEEKSPSLNSVSSTKEEAKKVSELSRQLKERQQELQFALEEAERSARRERALAMEQAILSSNASWSQEDDGCSDHHGSAPSSVSFSLSERLEEGWLYAPISSYYAPTKGLIDSVVKVMAEHPRTELERPGH